MANVENGALQTAIDNVAVGETVVLTNDITLTNRVTVANVVTIDLNGFTIASNFNDSYGAIYVGTKGVLTIVDNSSKQTGSIINTVGNAIGNYGSVIVYGGTFIGNYALYNFYYSNTIYGTSVIYGGTFKSTDKDSPSIANCGNLTVNGGTIETLDTTNVLNVTDGTIKNLYVGTADYNPEKQNTSISGGHIATLTIENGSVNEIVVSGGTFDNAVDSQYLAEGFEFAYDEGTGAYGVVTDSSGASNNLKVIATSSSRIRDLVIKNGQLIFIRDLKRIAFDFNNTRVFYNQIVELDTEADRLALENPLNGYYFVIGSACLWYYKDGWTQITERPKEVIFIGVELPDLGQEGKLYIDTDDKEISVWDDETDTYIAVSNYTEEASDIDIEKLFN
ncbi:MAG: hypothetical protein J6R59_09760 [Paludibacteraceae bacterium]|nr:hypothetical protein [Paludibacteraceae bacterium]